MKNYLQAFKTSIFATAITLMFSSCGGFLGFDITDQNAIDSNLRPKLEEALDSNLPVLQIRLGEGGGETFSKTIQSATVDYLDTEADEVKSKLVTLSGKTEVKDTHTYGKYKNDDDNKLIVTLADTRKLSEIDFSKIADIVKKAGTMVEKTENEFSGITGFTMKLNSDPSKVTYQFTVQSRQDAKTTTKSGKLATEISYLKFNFDADAQGNVTMKE